MKTQTKIVKVFIAFALSASLLFTTSCTKDDPAPAPLDNIVTLAGKQSNLSSLVTALGKYPDLVSTLSGNGTFTVFAPTNDAFTALLAAVGQTSIDDIPEPVLKSILQYHVVSTAALKSTQIVAGNLLTANTENIVVTTSGGIKLNIATNVVTANVSASNGVVHIIDKVLVPPTIVPIVGTIVAPAYFNKQFTTLIAAVKAADPSILTTLLSSTTNGFTLFAPTNAAFTKAGITTLPSQATLTAVLQYHVLPTKVLQAGLPTGSAAITTLNGKFYLSNGAGGVFINGKTKVTATNIQATNGVVHVIDQTLLPPAKTIAALVTDYSNGSSPQFTQLLAALARTGGQATDLLAAVSNDGNLTVFAPTDAAFASLYAALGVTGVNDVPLATLTDVLKKHVIASRVFSTDLQNGTSATLNGNVTINTTNLTVSGSNGNVASLVPASLNILATNGVIHVIDKVLVP
ncbi:hypothetical protein BH09BAC3_BH09BAC3_27790 [soil metagenome]